MTWLSLLRVLAVGGVIMVHAASGDVVFSAIGTSDWWAGNAFNSFARWCVPVFVLISGALLLAPDKHQTARPFYARRMNRVLIPLAFWSVIYLAWSVGRAAVRGEPMDTADLVARVASGRPYYHLWYLYMIVPLYLATPLVQRLVAARSRRALWQLTALGFILSAIYSGLRYAYEIPSAPFPLWFVAYLPYFVAGHLLMSADRRSAQVWWAVFAAAGVATAVGCYLLATWYGIYPALGIYSYHSLTVVAMSISVFLLARDWSPDPGGWARLAPLTLGIYLIHPLVLGPLNSVQGWLSVPSWAWIPLASAVAFGASAGAALVIRRIPVLRHVI